VPGSPKVHFLYDAYGEHKPFCGPRGNGGATTWDRREVTCGNCRKSLLGVARVLPSQWRSYIAGLNEEAALKGRPEEVR
jgi:hypothetical protein